MKCSVCGEVLGKCDRCGLNFRLNQVVYCRPYTFGYQSAKLHYCEDRIAGHPLDAERGKALGKDHEKLMIREIK